MNNLFYQRIAFTNLKKNANIYIPFILTSIGTIIMFYNACALYLNDSTGTGDISMLMGLGTTVTGIFSVIFLFYTNSFLVKRRKKEWGLYNILGMEKKHIAKISMWENIFISLFTIILGTVLGIIFSKLFTLLLHKILNFDPSFGFEVDVVAVIITILCFVAIFILILINSIIVVYRAKPIELLRGTNVGEKEPKTNWVMAIIGILTLGAGYTIALITENFMLALPLFLLAVILVIIGTYCLFTAGSIALLKILKKNKGYYYKTKHFTAISGLIYRMKQNAAGLASICIMSTMVLVMISTTVSLYVGVDDIISTSYPYDVDVRTYYDEDKPTHNTDVSNKLKDYMDNSGMPYKNFFSYSSLDVSMARNGSNYDADIQADATMSNISLLVFLTKDDYKKYTGESLEPLGTDEVAVHSVRKHDSLSVLGKEFTVKTQIDKDPTVSTYSTYVADVVYVIVPDITYMQDIYNRQVVAYENDKEYYFSTIEYYSVFDFDTEDEQAIEFVENQFIPDLENGDVIGELDFSYGYGIKHTDYDSMINMYGGLLFLGIFLGFLFLMATVLIIYYKQVVEGLDDRGRFDIMQKIGMSHKEVKQSVKSQILTVFALPLLVAVIHLAVAFPILTKLLQMLNLTNVSLFVICTVITVLAFALIYCAIYLLTSKVYYKIVNQNTK